MNVLVAATTQEIKRTSDTPEITKKDAEKLKVDMQILAGQAGGICYSSQDYFTSSKYGYEKSYDRYLMSSKMGHHSIAEHPHISLVFENIPKFTAMILNSMGIYATSEKSGRYTIMTDDMSILNNKLYQKWQNILYGLICEYYPQTKPNPETKQNPAKKLAMEQARDFISVFAPYTTMEYTVSFRQFCYIVDMCDRTLQPYDKMFGYHPDYHMTPLNKNIYDCLYELRKNLIATGLYDENLKDIYCRGIEFIPEYNNGQYTIFDANETIGDTYLVKYRAPLSVLAQLQRHRTIKYAMRFLGSEYDFHVPPLLFKVDNDKGTDYVKQWLEDMESVSETTPIGTNVDIVETGTIDAFMMQCDERLCSRVMWATMNTVKSQLLRFADYAKNPDTHVSPYFYQQLGKHYDFDNDRIIPKCGHKNCTEVGPLCGCKLDRLV